MYQEDVRALSALVRGVVGRIPPDGLWGGLRPPLGA